MPEKKGRLYQAGLFSMLMNISDYTLINHCVGYFYESGNI